MDLKQEKNNKFQPAVLWLIFVSWIISIPVVGRVINGFIVFIFLLIVFLLYGIKSKLEPKEVLKICGIRRAKITTLLLYALGTVAIAFTFCSWILPKILNMDVNRFIQLTNYYSEIDEISKEYGKLINIIGWMSFYVYQTFFEEFIFRGLIMRKLLSKYNFWISNIVQAVIFGSLHLLNLLSMTNIPMNYKIFIFLSPTIGGLLLGYAYGKTDNNLITPWIAHYLANAIPDMLYILFGIVMVT